MDRLHFASPPAYTPLEFQRAVRTLVCAHDVDFADFDSRCWTLFGGLSLGVIDVFRKEGIGVRTGCRTYRHIVEDGMDDFLISMPRSALITLSRPGNARPICLKPGQVAFVSLAEACNYRMAAANNSEPFAMTHVKVSGALLRRRIPQMDAYCHRPLELRPGAGKILESLFDLALSEGANLSAAESENFARMLIDAVANVVRAAPELSCLNESTSAQLRIRDAAKNFIEGHLSNPELSVAEVAQHCRVSVRYLHKVFSAASQSVSAYIRESRLRACRAALQTQAFRDKSVTDIAMMWGFSDSSSFCRAYKTYFGLVPSKDRDARQAC